MGSPPADPGWILTTVSMGMPRVLRVQSGRVPRTTDVMASLYAVIPCLGV